MVVPDLIIGEILMSSGLFTSKSDAIRTIKQKGVKVNNVQVEDFNEKLEIGDFLNFIWFNNALEMIKDKNNQNNFLVVAKGKSKVLLQVNNDKTINILAG